MIDPKAADAGPNGPRSPLELLEVMAREEVVINEGLRHLEIYTMRGLLTDRKSVV